MARNNTVIETEPLLLLTFYKHPLLFSLTVPVSSSKAATSLHQEGDESVHGTCVALYDYSTSREDELCLHKGNISLPKSEQAWPEREWPQTNRI